MLRGIPTRSARSTDGWVRILGAGSKDAAAGARCRLSGKKHKPLASEVTKSEIDNVLRQMALQARGGHSSQTLGRVRDAGAPCADLARDLQTR